MDAALKQDAIVAESVIGTTPSSPAFKVLRTINVGGGPQRPNSRSPERVPHGMAVNMYQGLVQVEKTLEFPWVRDEGLDIIWGSLFYGAWATNVLKNGQTVAPFTLEEKYEAGTGTDFYRRTTGCLANSATIRFGADGEPGRISFNVVGRAETTATSALASSTYAAATPGYDPVTAAEIVGTGIFGLSSPLVTGLNMTITNNLRTRYAFGSPNPNSHGKGAFDVSGTIEFYLAAMANYSGFTTRQQGLALDLLIGSVGNYKDQLELMNCDVWNPGITDGGNNTDHSVSLQFMAKYDGSDTAAIKLTRLAA
jgi:hypothetical protein